MTIETAIRQFLLDIPEIKILVDRRIWPKVLYKDANGKKVPAITYTRVGRSIMATHSGGGFKNPSIQLSCWANDHDTVRYLAETVVFALHGYKGLMGGMRVGAVFHESDNDLYEPTTGYHHVPVTIQVNHR